MSLSKELTVKNYFPRMNLTYYNNTVKNTIEGQIYLKIEEGEEQTKTHDRTVRCISVSVARSADMNKNTNKEVVYMG